MGAVQSGGVLGEPSVARPGPRPTRAPSTFLPLPGAIAAVRVGFGLRFGRYGVGVSPGPRGRGWEGAHRAPQGATSIEASVAPPPRAPLSPAHAQPRAPKPILVVFTAISLAGRGPTPSQGRRHTAMLHRSLRSSHGGGGAPVSHRRRSLAKSSIESGARVWAVAGAGGGGVTERFVGTLERPGKGRS